MPFAAVIFDMDGTLVDSEIVWDQVERQMFADRGLAYPDSVRQQVLGLRLDEFWSKLIRIYGLPETVEALSNELIERVQAVIPTLVKPKSGAQALIEYVAAMGLPYCIASSSPLVIIDSTVIAQGWDALIPLRYTADDVANGKPAPDVYLYAAHKLGVDPKACLALEDSPNGARSAVAAGMTTYVVPDFHSDASKFAGITPHVFPSLEAVLAHLSA